MKNPIALSFLLTANIAMACGGYGSFEPARPVSPAAFHELEKKLDPDLKAFAAWLRDNPGKPAPQHLRQIAEGFDAAAGQRDAYASRLYWFTDLEAAKSEAQRTNRPIVSLRLLGKLTEEFSCANSRLFRSLLYSDPAIAQLLRENFVLHWESVRPVPKVTIDFGDGRILRRTVTGNSIHYILTPEGKVVDALPGLYQPTVFRAELAETLAFMASNENRPSPEASIARIGQKRTHLLNAWEADLAKIGARGPTIPVSQAGAKFPSAKLAMPLAVSKAGIEVRLISVANPTTPKLDRNDPSMWEKIAELHRANTLSANSTAFVAAKLPAAEIAANLTTAKRIVEDPLMRVMRRLEGSLSADTVRNQYDFRPRILSKIAENRMQLSHLNDWVYADIFLTPKADKWLGLRSDDVFAALENDGIGISE